MERWNVSNPARPGGADPPDPAASNFWTPDASPLARVGLILAPVAEQLMEVLLALDRLGNALLAGRSEDTISARAGRALDESEAARALCAVLDHLDAEHCLDALPMPPPERTRLAAHFKTWRDARQPELPTDQRSHEAP